MRICNMLSPSLVKVDLQSIDKNGLFEEMVDMFVSSGVISDREGALDALYDRESRMTTGVAPGFALPHGKLAGVKGVIMVLGISREGIEYDAMDGEPVHVVLMLFSEPSNPAPHIEALAEVGRLLSIPGLQDKIVAAPDAKTILNLLSLEE